MQEHVLGTIKSAKLAAYVVWLPVLNYQDAPTLQKNARRYHNRIPDPRALHYTDPEGYTGKAYGAIMEIPHGAPAWDIYFVFDAQVQWGEKPPRPTEWMHQLGRVDPSRRLDAKRMAEIVRGLVAQAEQAEAQPANP